MRELQWRPPGGRVWGGPDVGEWRAAAAWAQRALSVRDYVVNAVALLTFGRDEPRPQQCGVGPADHA
eukprot:8516567-Pyramimonas_sp.AAC.1